jgi:hypothetical protein
MSRDDIQKYSNEISKSLKRCGIKGIMEISLLYQARESLEKRMQDGRPNQKR